MSRRAYKKGSTSVSVNVFIGDSTLQGTTRGGKTGLAFNTASLKAYYSRTGSASAAITLATLADNTAAWSSGGFVEIDGTNMPGVYRLDIPNAALGTGVNEVEIIIFGATGMCAETVAIDLINQEVGDLNTGAITTATFAAGAINNAALATGAIAAGNFAANAITATVVADGTIDLATFAAGAIDSTVLAANAVGASQIASSAITAAKFAANAITSTVIAASAIGASQIASAALTDAKFDVIPDLASDPGTTPSVFTAMALQYAALRNKSTATATARTIANNAGATILTKTLSDDGTTFSASKVA